LRQGTSDSQDLIKTQIPAKWRDQFLGFSVRASAVEGNSMIRFQRRQIISELQSTDEQKGSIAGALRLYELLKRGCARTGYGNAFEGMLKIWR